MREDNHDIQTPKKEHLPVASSSNRMAKQMNAASKKIHHQPQKDDSVLSLPEKEPIEKFSLISESVDSDQSTVEISRLSSASDKTLVLDKSLVLEHPEELIEISPISEAFVFCTNQSNESIEQLTYVTLNSLQLTPSSCTSPVLSSISTLKRLHFHPS